MNNRRGDQPLISTLSERLFNGLIKENPTFVLMLGMCPTLAVTTSAMNGLGMGITTMLVLAMSNLIISALRKVIPSKVRIPAFIVIIASFVTIVELLLKAFIPSLYDALGIYIPLIVVNCIILGRAESYASSHPVLPSLFDGLGMGLGFSLALTIIGGFREILGSGKLFGYVIMPDSFVPASIFVMAPGAFFVLAMLTAIQNKVKEIGERKGKDMSKVQSGCNGNCMECSLECKDREVSAEEKATNETVDVTDTAKKTNGLIGKLSTKKEKSVKEKKEHGIKEKNVWSFIKTQEENLLKDESNENAESSDLKVSESEETDTKITENEVSEEKEEATVSETVQEVSENLIDEKGDKEETLKLPIDDEEDDLEMIDLRDYRNAIKKSLPSGRKPQRKNAREKAQAMLSKAEKLTREDKDND